jgi:alcohol dehydrogenase class IV
MSSPDPKRAVPSPKRQKVVREPAPIVSVNLPQSLVFGAKASISLPNVLKQLGLKQPMLVTDAFVASSGMLKPIITALDDAGFSHQTFSGCVPDPTTTSVAAGLAAWRQAPEGARCDCMVGVGGGSSIDSAKAIALLAVAPADAKMRDFKVPNAPPAGLPIVAIPTTAGTGSEVTRVTIITDDETNEKMLCMGFSLMPRAAIVDYTLTLSMPYRLTADSGLDSLCHAMEAYVSKKRNAFSDGHALAAMKAIPVNLRAVCADLSNGPAAQANESAREALMLAATHAGIAFSNASVTLIHGMSRPIGAHFHVPHGLSNAMLLPIVTEFSLPGAPDRYAECARAMGFASEADDEAAAGEKLLQGLRALCAELRVPSPCEHGISAAKYEELLETMAQQALASGSPGNNPLVPTSQQIVELYRRVYKAE